MFRGSRGVGRRTFGGPKGSLGLLVHGPHIRVLNRKEYKPFLRDPKHDDPVRKGCFGGGGAK
jgi:hypothetical protein